MKKNILSLFTALAFINTIGYSQDSTEPHCGTTEVWNELIQKNPALAQEHETYYNGLLQKANNPQSNARTVGQVYVIPVVFHILHNYGPENISDAQILNQMDILNRDFRKLNSDTTTVVGAFKNLIADCEIEFRLATIDPWGNCTNGIDRIVSSKTYTGGDEAKLNRWPREKYLNIWVTNSVRPEEPNVLAYAYFPSSATGLNFVYDGILIGHRYVGSIGTAVGNPGDYTRTLTHEVGHYLSLAHTWGFTNAPEVSCGDDGISDTPVTEGHFSCGLLTASCDTQNFVAVHSFSQTTTSSGTTDTSAVNTSISKVNFGKFSAVGLSTNSANNGSFSFSKWPTGANNGETQYSGLTGVINTAKYYEVKIDPKTQYILNLSQLNFFVSRSDKGPRTFAVRASKTNNFGSNLSASLGSANPDLSVQTGNVFFFKNDTNTLEGGCRITLTGTAYTTDTTGITFRIYAWNAEDSTGTFTIDSFSFKGGVTTIENVQNYMEYSTCQKMFTPAQKNLMHATLNSPVGQRNNLWQPANLLATGTDNSTVQVCAPKADFTSNTALVCAGGTVTFSATVSDGVASSYQWSFAGGTPATSTLANPTVTYPNAGWYDASLTVSNNYGSSSKTYNNMIIVSPLNAGSYGPISEDFENVSNVNDNWISRNIFSNISYWHPTSAAGYQSASSMLLNNVNTSNGDLDDLITSSYDLTYMTNMSVNFKLACASTAPYSQYLTDKLTVYSSTNCGKTWNFRYEKTGAALVNAGNVTGSFVPTLSSQWANHTFALPINGPRSNVRLKFVYSANNYSNNVYLDNLNITGTVGMDENSIFQAVSLYPNPTNEETTLSYVLNSSESIRIAMYDVVGKEIAVLANNNQNSGEHLVTINKNKLNIGSGVYFIQLSSSKGISTHKMVINE